MKKVNDLLIIVCVVLFLMVGPANAAEILNYGSITIDNGLRSIDGILKDTVNQIQQLKSLDVHSPCQTQNGCKVQVWSRNYSPHQTWYLSNGEIKNAFGKCLDVHAPCQYQNGCKVQIWDCNGARNQTWQVVGDTIRSGAGKCFDVHKPCRTQDECKVQVWDCN